MALLRPNLTIVLDLDERLAASETQLEIKRCWAHVGTPVIRTHASKDCTTKENQEDKTTLSKTASPQTTSKYASTSAPQENTDSLHNTLRLMIGLGTAKYLYSSDEGADKLWNEVVGPSVSNMLHKIGSTMQTFNTRQRKIGLPEIVFTRFDVELQNGEFIVGLHPDAASGLDRPLRAQVDFARELLNNGTLEGALRVDIPSDEAYRQQSEDARKTWEEAQAAKAGQQAAVAKETDIPNEQAERMRALAEQSRADKELGTARFFDEEWLAADAERKSYENTAVEPVDTDELPPAFHLPEEEEPERFNFEVDYTLWSITFADGSRRTFNSITKAFSD